MYIMTEIDKTQLVSNIKKKDLCVTSYGNYIYSNFWYVCN